MNTTIIWQYIFWTWFSLYFLYAIFDVFHLRLWWEIFRGKRKFFSVKITAHLWPQTGEWNFNNPSIYIPNVRDYLAKNPVKIGPMLVEENPTECKSFFFTPVDEKGNIDYLFRSAARNPSAPFHVDKKLVTYKTPATFSFLKGLIYPLQDKYWTPHCGMYNE
jgi:hypothetical protein